jgi:hypothetical protein
VSRLKQVTDDEPDEVSDADVAASRRWARAIMQSKPQLRKDVLTVALLLWSRIGEGWLENCEELAAEVKWLSVEKVRAALRRLEERSLISREIEPRGTVVYASVPL